MKLSAPVISCFFALYWSFYANVAVAQTETPKSTSASDTLSVLCWNVQLLPDGLALFSKALRKKQRIRCPWIADYCLDLSPDVIVFQEVFDVQMTKQLKKALASAYPYQVDPLKHKGRFTSSGILIVSKYPLSKVGEVVYDKGLGADAWAAKGCTLVEVNKRGRTFAVAGTHLQAGGNSEAQAVRNQQYVAINNLLGSPAAKLPLLIAGDMNTKRANCKDFQRMLEVLDVADYPLDDPRPYTSDTTNSWKSAGKPSQLDYVFLKSGSISMRFLKQEILRPTKDWKSQQMDLADHYAILATIYWQP